jgi:hypothetical protein
VNSTLLLDITVCGIAFGLWYSLGAFCILFAIILARAKFEPGDQNRFLIIALFGPLNLVFLYVALLGMFDSKWLSKFIKLLVLR